MHFVVEIPSGNILDFSASVLDQLATDRATLLSTSFSSLIPSATWQQMLVLFGELGYRPKSTAFVNAELSIGAPGRKLPVEIAIQVLAIDGRMYATLAARDNTAHRKSEQALRDNQQRLHAIVYGSPIPQFVLGASHAIISWNGALEKYTGISAESVVGTHQHWRAFYSVPRPCLAGLIIARSTKKRFPVGMKASTANRS